MEQNDGMGKTSSFSTYLKIYESKTGINSLMSYIYSVPSELEKITFLGNGKHGPFILLLIKSVVHSYLSLFSM